MCREKLVTFIPGSTQFKDISTLFPRRSFAAGVISCTVSIFLGTGCHVQSDTGRASMAVAGGSMIEPRRVQ